jgi:hypothetical protein
VLLVVPVVMLLKVILLALIEQVARTWILTSKLLVLLAAAPGTPHAISARAVKVLLNLKTAATSISTS